jgi:hypothetical protein
LTQGKRDKWRSASARTINLIVAALLRKGDTILKEVLAWHRQVQQDVLAALREAPEEWFGGRERRSEWPFDLEGHSTYHRFKDIERALRSR